MRVVYPYLGLLLGCVPLIAFFFFRQWKARQALIHSRFSKPMQEVVLAHFSAEKRLWKQGLFLVAISLLIVAMMRPQFGIRYEEVKRKARDIVIVLDTSASMLAEDVRPSRFEKAKQEILGLVNVLDGDRIGLVPFSGYSYIQTPLTRDYRTLQLFLEDVRVGDISQGGTNIAHAIETALGAFSKEALTDNIIVVISDGEAFEGDALEMAARARKEYVIIYSIGVGTPAGEPIPLRDTLGHIRGYKQDSRGKPVVSALQETKLRAIAEETGGQYFLMTDDSTTLDALYRLISRRDTALLNGRMAETYTDRYQLFLFLAFVILVAEFILTERKRFPGAGKETP